MKRNYIGVVVLLCAVCVMVTGVCLKSKNQLMGLVAGRSKVLVPELVQVMEDAEEEEEGEVEESDENDVGDEQNEDSTGEEEDKGGKINGEENVEAEENGEERDEAEVKEEDQSNDNQEGEEEEDDKGQKRDQKKEKSKSKEKTKQDTSLKEASKSSSKKSDSKIDIKEAKAKIETIVNETDSNIDKVENEIKVRFEQTAKTTIQIMNKSEEEAINIIQSSIKEHSDNTEQATKTAEKAANATVSGSQKDLSNLAKAVSNEDTEAISSKLEDSSKLKDSSIEALATASATAQTNAEEVSKNAREKLQLAHTQAMRGLEEARKKVTEKSSDGAQEAYRNFKDIGDVTGKKLCELQVEIGEECVYKDETQLTKEEIEKKIKSKEGVHVIYHGDTGTEYGKLVLEALKHVNMNMSKAQKSVYQMVTDLDVNTTQRYDKVKANMEAIYNAAMSKIDNSDSKVTQKIKEATMKAGKSIKEDLDKVEVLKESLKDEKDESNSGEEAEEEGGEDKQVKNKNKGKSASKKDTSKKAKK